MMMDSVQTASPSQPTEELTELGKCLLKHEVSAAKTHPITFIVTRLMYHVSLMFVFVLAQNIYMTLLTLSFTSLSWKDTTNCHRTASMVCWTLLRQVGKDNHLFLVDFCCVTHTHFGGKELLDISKFCICWRPFSVSDVVLQ